MIRVASQPDRRRGAPWLIAACGGLILLQALSPPRPTLWWRSLFNFGHLPLYGLIAWAMLSLAPARGPLRVGAGWPRYAWAWAAAMVVGGLTELAQLGGAREASWRDLAMDAAGAASFLLLRALFDRRLAWGSGRRGRLLRAASIVAVAAALLVAAAFPLRLAAAYAARDAAFPSLCSFDARWERPFLDTRRVRVEIGPLPPPWRKAAPDAAARVTFLDGTYPQIAITEPVADWSGFEQLCFEIYSGETVTVRLGLRIDDSVPPNEYRNRFHRRLKIHPGKNEIRVSLDEVRRAPAGRELDLTRIRRLSLYATRPPQPLTVWLDDFRLERERGGEDRLPPRPSRRGGGARRLDRPGEPPASARARSSSLFGPQSLVSGGEDSLESCLLWAAREDGLAPAARGLP